MFTVNKRHSAIADLCRPKNGGSHIEGVYVRNESNRTTIEASDGHVLIRVKTDNHAEDYPDIGVGPAAKDSAIIPAGTWQAMLKPLPKKARLSILQNAMVSPQQEDKAIIGHTDLEKVAIETIRTVTAENALGEPIWPKLDFVLNDHAGIKAEDGEDYVIAFNPKLLARLLEVFVSMEADYVDLLLPQNPTCAMQVKAETPHGDTVEAAIMPMRRS